jgi:hypothetical protein
VEQGRTWSLAEASVAVMKLWTHHAMADAGATVGSGGGGTGGGDGGLDEAVEGCGAIDATGLEWLRPPRSSPCHTSVEVVVPS